jgi:1-acyl-sn-glycerol-3-phosphate acyltransferase
MSTLPPSAYSGAFAQCRRVLPPILAFILKIYLNQFVMRFFGWLFQALRTIPASI